MIKSKYESILRKNANKLRNNIPKSELWFLKKVFNRWVPMHYIGKSNVYLSEGIIPDFINLQFKYVIEVDDPSHNSLKSKQKDKLKDSIYHSKKFKVIRVKAYCDESFEDCMNKILSFYPETSHEHKLLASRLKFKSPRNQDEFYILLKAMGINGF